MKNKMINIVAMLVLGGTALMSLFYPTAEAAVTTSNNVSHSTYDITTSVTPNTKISSLIKNVPALDRVAQPTSSAAVKTAPSQLLSQSSSQSSPSSLAKNTANFFKNVGDKTKNDGSLTTAVTSQAKDIVLNEINHSINQNIEQLLGNAVHSAIHFGFNQRGYLQHAAGMLLVPLYNMPAWLVFLQTSFHRDSNDQWTGNFGLGERYFSQHWMLGSNVFYDRNFTAQQQRIGVGLEYWRNNFKLAANGYFRLSNQWRVSSLIQDYLARPANGWDIDMQAWIPSLPQLGGEVKYEQYYGNQVELTGDDPQDLTKNPYQFTIGMNYTPIPLIQLGLALQSSQAHPHNLDISLTLNFLFGESLASQLDPTSVAGMRSLMGQRYDFVHRNNNIVLQYKKKLLVIISMIQSIDARAGEIFNLDTQVVKSKYHPTTIQVTAPTDFVAQGGQIIQQGINNYQVKLPNYNESGKNQYILTGVGVDAKGDQSSVIHTLVTVQAAAISIMNSTVSLTSPTIWISPPTLNANASGSKISITLKNTEGQPVTGVAQDLLLSTKCIKEKNTTSEVDPRLQSIHPIEDPAGSGIYVDNILPGTAIGDYQLNINLVNEKSSLTPKGVPFNELYNVDLNTLHISQLQWSNANQPALDDDPNSVNTLIATVVDQSGRPAPAGTPVTFSVTDPNTIKPVAGSSWIATVGNNGQAILHLTSDKTIPSVTENGMVTAQLVNKQGKKSSKQIAIQFLADVKNAHVIALTSTASAIYANGPVDTLTATVADNTNNPLPNQSVTLSTNIPTPLIFDHQQLTTNSAGQAIAHVSLTSTSYTGPVVITAHSQQNRLDNHNTLPINIGLGQLAIQNLTWLNQTTPAISDGKQEDTLVAKVTDQYGNVAPKGTLVTFKADKQSKIQPVASTWSVPVNNQGEATIKLTSTHTVPSTVGGTGEITASLATGSSLTQPITFFGIASQLQIVSQNSLIIGNLNHEKTTTVATQPVTLQVEDQDAQPIVNTPITVTPSNINNNKLVLESTAQQTTNSKGEVTLSFEGQVPDNQAPQAAGKVSVNTTTSVSSDSPSVLITFSPTYYPMAGTITSLNGEKTPISSDSPIFENFIGGGNVKVFSLSMVLPSWEKGVKSSDYHYQLPAKSLLKVSGNTFSESWFTGNSLKEYIDSEIKDKAYTTFYVQFVPKNIILLWGAAGGKSSMGSYDDLNSFCTKVKKSSGMLSLGQLQNFYKYFGKLSILDGRLSNLYWVNQTQVFDSTTAEIQEPTTPITSMIELCSVANVAS